jgi:transposase
MVTRFQTVDRATPYLLPQSIEDWLPEDHLARFVVEVVSKLDLAPLRASYAGRGSTPYDPGMLLSLLFYGYATGVRSSRKIEAATHDSVAFRYIAANSHPDHDTIASFRLRFLVEIGEYFVRILEVARETGMRQVGSVSLDGTKVKANASKHRAMSYRHARKIREQLRDEVDELLRMAEEADRNENRTVIDVPAELKRREKRLDLIESAVKEIEHRAAETYRMEKEEYDGKMAVREKKEKTTGKKAKGKKPAEPKPGPGDKDQVNFTDEESRIMPVSGGGFEQAYNAQAVVDNASRLIVGTDLGHAPVDRQALQPVLEAMKRNPEGLTTPETVLADAGYCSKQNVEYCVERGIEPLISLGREQHNIPLLERCGGSVETSGTTEETESRPDSQFTVRNEEEANPIAISCGPTVDISMDRMKVKLKTPEGRAEYGKRKSVVEPVFGIIKEVLKLRQFLLRGMKKAKGEWTLACMAYNLKRMHIMQTS